MSHRDLLLSLPHRLRTADPRGFQIGFLMALLVFVVGFREFTLQGIQMAAILAAAFATQAAFIRALGLPPAGPMSPLITGLSLCLLLRSGSIWVPVLAAGIGIAGKFLLRVGGKHLFNPSALGLAVALAFTGDAWSSAGQWGNGTLLAFALGGLGLMTVGKVGRLDITGALLVAHLSLLLGRVLWLGQPFAVFGHQMLSGSLILFAFFMISDPRSTPDGRAGRILFAVAVAVVAHVLRFHLFWNQSLIWALIFVSPVTPVLDRLWRHAPFQWRHGGTHVEPTQILSLAPSPVVRG